MGIPTVQSRGKAIIDARGFSSALSAANATKDCLRDWVRGTPQGQTVAMSVFSEGAYDIAKGIFYSVPCTAKDGEFTVVTDYKVTADIQALMKASEKELWRRRRRRSTPNPRRRRQSEEDVRLISRKLSETLWN